jgi:hypothetical protein
MQGFVRNFLLSFRDQVLHQRILAFLVFKYCSYNKVLFHAHLLNRHAQFLSPETFTEYTFRKCELKLSLCQRHE